MLGNGAGMQTQGRIFAVVAFHKVDGAKVRVEFSCNELSHQLELYLVKFLDESFLAILV